MLETILNLLLISLIIVLIDLSGWWNSVKRGVSWVISKGKLSTDNWELPLLGCPLCLSWWCSVIYLLVVGKFSLLYLFISLNFSFLTPVFNNVFILIKEWLITVTNKLMPK